VTEAAGPEDFGRSHPWPDDLTAHLDTFRQGHIVDHIPVFFLGSGQKLWNQPRRDVAPLPDDTTLLVAEPLEVVRSAMLLTQACDLMKPRNPWATVAPVYEATGRLTAGDLGLARVGRITHFVHLTAPWTAGEFWVADLRLELPVEKSVLADREPRDAFSSEVEYATLAERLGAQRARPATPQACLKWVVEPLYALLAAMGDAGISLLAGVREIRLQWNDPHEPTVVTVFVIGTDDTDSTPDASGWSSVIDQIYEHASENGLTIVGPELTTLWQMSAADYITSALIQDTQSS